LRPAVWQRPLKLHKDAAGVERRFANSLGVSQTHSRRCYNPHQIGKSWEEFTLRVAVSRHISGIRAVPSRLCVGVRA